MPTLYKEDIATKVTMNSNITYSLSLFLKLHCADYTIAVVSVCVCAPYLSGVCLSQRDFAQALKGFTPPSLWGVDVHTPSGVGLERVGGLREVRQQLMDTILLPAKVGVSLCAFCQKKALQCFTG